MAKKKFDWYHYHLKTQVIFDPLNIALEPYQILVVIGDIHEKKALFDALIDKIYAAEEAQHYEIVLVSVGDIFDKGDGPEAGNEIFQKLKRLGAYVLGGNHEAKKVNWQDANTPWQELEKLPLALSFVYPNQHRFTIVHGGVTPNHTWDDLKFNTDILYVREVDAEGNYIPYIKTKLVNGGVKYAPKMPGGINWHENYDGRFGYMITGHHAQKDGLAKFYYHSCNLDTAAYITGTLTAGVFNQYGFQKLIQASNDKSRS